MSTEIENNLKRRVLNVDLRRILNLSSSNVRNTSGKMLIFDII
jgi:hypothetical protein